jgi:3-dehydroquinate synthase
MTHPVSARVDVATERGSYPVVVGPGALRNLAELLGEAGIDSGSGAAMLVVTAAPVWRAQARRFRRLPAARRPLILADGERAKTLATAGTIFDALIARRLDRAGAILAIGGGVVGDVAGFAAATYLRGIRVVHVPTTLLAQVDSAIGGKVGVNHTAGKNLLGAFHPPSLVVCDPDVLSTLPRREFRSGLYEVIKYGVIASPRLFDLLEQRLDAVFAYDSGTLMAIVETCCRIKADVVAADERERGPRRALNFGHTVGHALEAITRYRRFRHGEAIGYGMQAASRLSRDRGLISGSEHDRLDRAIASLGARPPVGDLRVDDAQAAIALDKKVVRGRLHFVLARGLGATEVVDDVSRQELRRALKGIGLRA